MDETLTRRDMLVLGGRAALAAGAAPLLASCASDDSLVCPSAPPTAGATVYAARGGDLVQQTRDVLDAMGGIATVVSPGDRVFIKPNMVTLPWASADHDPFRAGECTKAEIVIATAAACLEAGAAEVIVGDGSQQPSFDWAGARYLDGSTNLAAEASRLSSLHGRPVRLSCLEVDTPEWVDVPTSLSLGSLAVSSLVMEADKVISIPVAKTHAWGYVTLSLKNFVGVTPLVRYGYGIDGRVDRFMLHQNDPSPKLFNAIGQDIVAAVGVDLAIVDFSIGMESQGPSARTGGLPVDVSERGGSWFVLASTDPVAADATSARIMSQDEWKIEAVNLTARERGLGAACESEIELVGASMAELRMPWRAADMLNWY